MSTIDIKVYNILVHYGEGLNKNLLELLDEVLLENLIAGQEIKLINQYMYPAEVKKISSAGKSYLTGYLFKSATLKWKTVPDDKKRHKVDPGNKKVLPYSYFILDLLDHRLFWVTERGLSSAPSAFNFASYIKKVSLPSLKQDYEGEAQAEWNSTPRNKRTGKWPKFLSQYLSDRNVSKNTFRVDLLPEVSSDKIKNILKKKQLIVRNATFYPKLNNITKNELKQLFTNVDEIASSMSGNPEVKVDAISKDQGLKKPALFELLDHNDKEQVLSFKFTIKDSSNPHSRPFVISNRDQEGHQSVQKTETIHDELDGDSLFNNVLGAFEELTSRTRTATELTKLKQKIVKILS